MVNYRPENAGGISASSPVGITAVAVWLGGFADHFSISTMSSMGVRKQDRLLARTPRRTTCERGAPVSYQFQLSGGNLDEAAPGDRQSGMASPENFVCARAHRDESVSAERVVAFYKTRRARCGSSSKRPRPTPFGEPAMLLAIDALNFPAIQKITTITIREDLGESRVG
jgi:hypothetical protein